MHEQGLAEEAPRLPRWSMKMEQRNNICALACVHHMRCQLRFRKSFRARRRMRFRHFNLVGPRLFGLKKLRLPESNPLPILADADRIGQVVNNYLRNALKYSAPERPVTISLECVEDGKLARVAVQDQGSGIAPQDLEHIWERFYRSSHATEQQHDNAEGGLGLGLYISRTIIEQHGGLVGVESVQGQGSTFWFTLPLFWQDERV